MWFGYRLFFYKSIVLVFNKVHCFLTSDLYCFHQTAFIQIQGWLNTDKSCLLLFWKSCRLSFFGCSASILKGGSLLYQSFLYWVRIRNADRFLSRFCVRQARSRRKVFAFRGQLAQHGAKDAEKMLRILVRSQYRLLVFILNLPKQKGTYPSAMHLASLESHHREDLPRAPSLFVTVFSRSTWDGTQVSLCFLPVNAQHGCAALSQD